jgi:hypothetical protein
VVVVVVEVTAAVIVVVVVVKKKRPSECDARSSKATRTVDAYHHRCSKSKIKQKKELAVTECESRSSPVVHGPRVVPMVVVARLVTVRVRVCGRRMIGEVSVHTGEIG